MSKLGKGSIGISVSEWIMLQEQYANGYASSSEWLKSFGVFDHIMPPKLTESELEKELTHAIIACASSVNIVRPIFGKQKKNSRTLSVSWCSRKNIENQGIPFSVSETIEAKSIIYLDPTPVISKSDYTCHQRYDCVIGDGLLQSVKKNTIDSESFKFMKILNVKGSLACVLVLQEDNKNFVSLMDRNGIDNYMSYTVPEPFFFRYNVPKEEMYIEGVYLRFIRALWTAVELLVAEKYLTKEFLGSKPYIYAHRNFYKKKRYLKNLITVSDQIMVDRDTIAFLNVIYKVLNPTSKYDCHPFYKKFARIISGMLNFDINITSKERLYNVICTVITGIYLLKKPGIFLRSTPEITDEPNKDSIHDPFDPIFSDEQINDIMKQIEESKNNKENKEKDKKEKDLENKIDDLMQKMEEAGMPHDEIGEQRKTKSTLKDSTVVNAEDSHSEAIKSFYGDILGQMHFSSANKSPYADEVCRNIEAKNHGIIQSIQERLRVLSILPIDPEYSLSSGNLDENGLYKLHDKTEDMIFYRETVVTKVNRSRITIIMDQSGSMGSGKRPRISSLQRVAVVLAKALADIPAISLSFYGHCNLSVYCYDSSDGFNSLGSINASGNTHEGYAVADIVQRVVSTKEDEVSEYMFVLGDGEVDLNTTKKAFAFAIANGIQIFHFGLDDAYTPEKGQAIYGDGRYAILPMENLLNAFVSIFCQLLVD